MSAALAYEAPVSPIQGMYVPIEKLLADREWSAYDLAREFIKRDLSAMAAYRLVQFEGKLTRYDARVLDALAEIFEIGPKELHRLLVYEPRKR